MLNIIVLIFLKSLWSLMDVIFLLSYWHNIYVFELKTRQRIIIIKKFIINKKLKENNTLGGACSILEKWTVDTLFSKLKYKECVCVLNNVLFWMFCE